jgi:hypothetical protein
VGPPPPPNYPPPPPPPPRAYDLYREADFAWSTATGAGTIVGLLAHKGDAARYTCQVAVLVPDTPWTRARMRTLYLSTVAADIPSDDVRARTPPDHADEYKRFVRQAPCAPGNRFAFSGLPDGVWYVISVATPVGGGIREAVMRRVETHGDTAHVILR